MAEPGDVLSLAVVQRGVSAEALTGRGKLGW